MYMSKIGMKVMGVTGGLVGNMDLEGASAQTHSPTPGQNEKLDGNNYRKLLSPKSISLQIQESSQIRKLHKTPPTQINFQFT